MVPSETLEARKVLPDEDLMVDPHRDPKLSRLLRTPREASALPAVRRNAVHAGKEDASRADLDAARRSLSGG